MIQALVIVGSVAFVVVLLVTVLVCRPVDDNGSAEVPDSVLQSPFDDPFNADVDR